MKQTETDRKWREKETTLPTAVQRDSNQTRDNIREGMTDPRSGE